MVKNNHYEPEKCTLVGWVDKALEQALTMKNIKNGFKTIRIWPLNPKVMDDNTKPSDVYTTKPSPNISNDDTNNYDNVVDEDQWGENGVG